MSASSGAVLPRYGERSLSELLPSLLAALGVPGAANPLGIAATRRACVLLVDGLGADQLAAHPEAAPYLSSLTDGSTLTAGFPATTATSLASLGTGLPPGEHGLLGYEVLVAPEPPGDPFVLNALHWDDRVDPRRWQPHPTVFERASAAGVAVTRIGPAAFAGSGLTEAAMRGGRFVAAQTAMDRVHAAAAATASTPRSLVYLYYGDLDAVGHAHGVDSTAWRARLGDVDRLAAALAERLPPGCALWITADHGMVDIAATGRVDVAAQPDLAAGVRVLTGDPRARYLHTAPGALLDVLAAWRQLLGDRADVLSRDEAIAAGLFGPVVPAGLRSRVGDVVVAARAGLAVVDSRQDHPDVLNLVGLHGSLTSAEQLVPVLEVR